MELYEIVKTEIIDYGLGVSNLKATVITATLDKAAAEQMFKIYKQNHKVGEAYQIRILSDQQPKWYEPYFQSKNS